LHLIPFSALVNTKGEYLNSELTLSTAPSATIYHTLSTMAKAIPASKPFLGIAFSPEAQSAAPSTAATRGVSDLRTGNLKPLRFAHEEITEAAKIFGPASVTLDGLQASENAVKALPSPTSESSTSPLTVSATKWSRTGQRWYSRPEANPTTDSGRRGNTEDPAER